MLKRLLFLILVMASLLTVPAPGMCQERKVVLTSLEWPPYTGHALPGQGMSTEVVRSVLEAVGYIVEIRYYPWKRAVEHARLDEDVDGYFPEYRSVERERLFLFSDPIGTSPVGLVEPRWHPVRWETLHDLSDLVIGTVQGYVNTPEFDRMVDEGKLRVDTSVSDLLNLRKVMAGRVALAVSDVNVFHYLTQVDKHLSKKSRMLQVNSQLLGVNELYVCFRKGRRGDVLVADFNRGLDQISLQDMQKRYLDSLLPANQ